MSSANTEIIVATNMGSKRRTATLPAKYSKFASFAFWLFGELKTAQIISEDSYSQICNFANLIGSDIPTQIGFYERFFAELPVVGKLLKAANKKPPQKPPKVQKPRVQKPRKTKTTPTPLSNNDIISQIVQRANSIDNDSSLPQDPQITLLDQQSLQNQDNPSNKTKAKATKRKPSSKTLPQDIPQDIPLEEEKREGIPVQSTVDQIIESFFEPEPQHLPVPERISTPVLKTKKTSKQTKDSKKTATESATEDTTHDAKDENPSVESKDSKKKTKSAKESAENGDGKTKKKAKPSKSSDEPHKPVSKKTTKKTKQSEPSENCVSTHETIVVSDEQLNIHQTDNNEDDQDDDELLELSVVMIDEVEYYFDSDNNLYDINKNIIGTFEPSTQEISINP